MRLKRTAIIIIALTALLAAAAAQAATGVLSFRANAEVDVRRVSLLDLVADPAGLDQQVRDKLKRVFVCIVPTRGNTRTIRGEALRGLLKKANLPKDLTTLLPAEVTIRRAVQLIDGTAIAQAYRDAVMRRLGPSARQADIHSIKTGSEQTVGAGDVEYKVRFLSDRILGRVPALVELIVNGHKVRHIRVTGVVDVYSAVVVASRTMSRGQIIGPEDLELCRMNLAEAPRGVVSNPDRLVGMRTRGSIGAGEAIEMSWVERTPLIKRGDIVTMIVQTPGLKISTKGRAEQTGYSGGSIRLTNLTTQRTVAGRVSDDGTVVVEF